MDNTTLESLQSYLDEYKQELPENHYLNISNNLKDIYIKKQNTEYVLYHVQFVKPNVGFSISEFEENNVNFYTYIHNEYVIVSKRDMERANLCDEEEEDKNRSCFKSLLNKNASFYGRILIHNIPITRCLVLTYEKVAEFNMKNNHHRI